MGRLINQRIAVLKSLTDEVIKELHELVIATGSDELKNLVSELRNRINEPFMFVVVGEVKAGKSSFINALLESEEEICAVGPQPVTDTIQQILYGETAETIQINPYLKKIFRPIPILKEIAIVDTPGTNTIIDQHQEITERFIPSADLIVFVFEAKNPYRQSAWQFLDFIKAEWQKKVIFVLQQKDLLHEEELNINLKGVSDQAAKKGLQEAPVFAASAKWEVGGETVSSGFAPLRTFIETNITGGQAPLLKLQNNLITSLKIHATIGEGLDMRVTQLDHDKAFRNDVTETLLEQENRSLRQMQNLLNSLLFGYDHITGDIARQLKQGLSFVSLLKKSFQSIFNKKHSFPEWLQSLTVQLDDQLHSTLNTNLSAGVTELAESIQQMARIIDLKIKEQKTTLPSNDDIFADITRRRNTSIEELKESFQHFLSHTDNFTAHELFPDRESVSPNLAAGGGLAVIGVILAAVTNGMIFDITGGVLTTIGILFAGISSGTKKRKVLQSFNGEIEKGRKKLEEEVSTRLKAYIHHIKMRIASNFSDFDLLLQEEERRISKLLTKFQAIKKSLDDIQEKLEKEQ